MKEFVCVIGFGLLAGCTSMQRLEPARVSTTSADLIELNRSTGLTVIAQRGTAYLVPARCSPRTDMAHASDHRGPSVASQAPSVGVASAPGSDTASKGPSVATASSSAPGVATRSSTAPPSGASCLGLGGTSSGAASGPSCVARPGGFELFGIDESKPLTVYALGREFTVQGRVVDYDRLLASP